MRELGRVFKTVFILDYLARPALRQRVRQGLLKSEELNAMARSVFYGKLGRADWRDFRRQMSSASCLTLIRAAIIYWQIREIERVMPRPGRTSGQACNWTCFPMSAPSAGKTCSSTESTCSGRGW